MLSYGEFGDYLGEYEKVVFIVMAIFLQMILANMLIAFMSNIYEQAEAKKDIEDTREKLIWIYRMQFHAFWDNKPMLGYLHTIKDVYA